MARIRTIKPTHWSDKALATIPLEAHLLWIGTWNFADDEGVFENDPLLIRSNIFPRRTDVSIPDIEGWLNKLVEKRFIIPFTYNSESYFIHRTFKNHQKIDRPQGSKIPEDVIRGIFDDNSTNVQPCIVEYSSGVEGNSPADKPQVKDTSKKRVSKKKNQDPEPYWDQIVEAWFVFNEEKYGGRPSFTGQDARNLKKLIGLLKARAKQKNVEWTERTALQRLNAYFVEAFADPWIKTHFLLNNLVTQFDKIILNHQQHATIRKNNGGTVVPITGGKSAGALELINSIKNDLAAAGDEG